jgi:tetratricopeptide (TPR) repeat protein
LTAVPVIPVWLTGWGALILGPAVLALLALFQGFVDIGDLCRMGMPGLAGGPVPAAADLDRAAWIGLLDRAAGIGLLTEYGNGYYAVHPAIPWHLHSLFSQHYGPPGSPAAQQAGRAWTTAISALGDHCHRQYEAGHADVIRVLTLNEANLLQARSHALEHRWLDLILGVMRGLRALYENTGRRVEWRQLVSGVMPSLTDAASDGPFPGLEHEWAVLTSYRVAIARQARDWPAAGELQHALLSWRREWAAAALATPAGQLDDEQRGRIRTLAAVLHDLGQILREQNNPGCLLPYQEAAGLCQLIGARREEVTIALNIGAAYLDVPALRDLDQAECWYKRNLELEEPHDTLNHARVTGQLARVAYERFFSARGAGAEDEQVRAQRNDAVQAYHRAIASFPADAVSDLAISHGQLGFIYGDAGDINQALDHYRQAIQYREREDNRFAAGNLRYTVALDLEKAGRTDDAVLYARAALRDYESGGPGAAAHADDARGLMARLAVALVNLSVLLASKGQQQDALTAIQRAVEIHEQVAETSPDAYLPALATSLDNLSVLLSVVGRREEGLTESRRTVTIWEKLAAVNPDAYRPNLAAALSNLSNRLGQAGQRAEGLAANQRALGIYEQLAVASPDAYLPEVAKSLTNLSSWLGDLGRPEEALAAIQRAVAIREPLAEANPDAYLPDLAASLNNLSNQLGQAGHLEEALAAIRRAVAIREPLAEANPDAYGSHLAMSLSNLSVRLGGLGRRVEALAAIQRAVAIQELLAEANPDAYLPDLAASLNNLSNQLGQAGQLEEALAAIRRAVAIREQQAAANPDAYRPNLARALNNLSRQLCGAGRWEEALAVIQRVVEIYEQLAGTSPAAHLPDLALSLNNLAVPLANTGRQEEALAAIQRAVTTREKLAEMSPDAHFPDLAKSLHNLSMPLAAAGRQEEGLASIQRAITIRRKLAERQPQAYEPDLAQSLLVLTDRLFDANDPVAAVEPILTAATLADRWHRQDLISPAGQRLRKARVSQPEAVTAEYERLTGSLWPQPGA